MALSVREQTAQIQRLPPSARLAGYLSVIAQLAALDASTTAKYDEYVGTGMNSYKMSTTERKNRNKLNNDLDAWFFALSAEERKIAALLTTGVFDKLARGGWPLSTKSMNELAALNERSIQVDPPETP